MGSQHTCPPMPSKSDGPRVLDFSLSYDCLLTPAMPHILAAGHPAQGPFSPQPRAWLGSHEGLAPGADCGQAQHCPAPLPQMSRRQVRPPRRDSGPQLELYQHHAVKQFTVEPIIGNEQPKSKNPRSQRQPCQGHTQLTGSEKAMNSI